MQQFWFGLRDAGPGARFYMYITKVSSVGNCYLEESTTSVVNAEQPKDMCRDEAAVASVIL